MTDQLQRRHFEAIAAIIKTFDMPEFKIKETREHARAALANQFADKLGHYNSNFDRDRFITAYLTGKMGKGRSHKNV